jgi:hypothetical protein
LLIESGNNANYAITMYFDNAVQAELYEQKNYREKNSDKQQRKNKK